MHANANPRKIHRTCTFGKTIDVRARERSAAPRDRTIAGHNADAYKRGSLVDSIGQTSTTYEKLVFLASSTIAKATYPLLSLFNTDAPSRAPTRIERLISQVNRGLAERPGLGQKALGTRELARAAFRLARVCEDISEIEQLLLYGGVPANIDEGAFRKQLSALDRRIQADLEKLVGLRDAILTPPRAALRPDDVWSPDLASEALARLLGDHELANCLGCTARGSESASKTLQALALLTDAALAAPDYASTGMGGWYAFSRSEYRERSPRAGSPRWAAFVARIRQDQSRRDIAATLRKALRDRNPKAALERAMVEIFVREIGITPEQHARVTPNAEAVRSAISSEVFLPLRALNENVAEMADAGGVSRAEVQSVVDEITKHIVEGDYREWRYENPASKVQLEALSDFQRMVWKETVSYAFRAYSPGPINLFTREEDGPELLWVTKIGGPSHGFDYGGNCLLPLLTNGRSKAILVEDERWPNNAAARAYIRMLPFADGEPSLYLEPLQRDFPHEDRFGYGDSETGSFRGALLQHAIAKAEALGVPLTVDKEYGKTLAFMNIPHHWTSRRYIVEPSAGIFEASDTLGLGHDFDNRARKVTPDRDRLMIGAGVDET